MWGAVIMDIHQWRSSGDTVSLNVGSKEHDIFVIDTREFDKPTILLIHGFPTSSWDWVKIWPKLGEHYRLVAMDLLGFGFSAKPKKHTYSIMEQADLVEALVTRLGLNEFAVLAHDYGDTVAQELLARQNECKGVGEWLSLCLLNGGLFPETHRALLMQKLLLSPLGPLVSGLISEPGFARTFSSIWGVQTQPTASELASYWQLINYNDGKQVFHKLITYMVDRRRNRERWVDALMKSCVPISLINGSADPISGAHMVERYQEIIGQPDHMVELATIGHYPQVEDSASVAEAYLLFLNTKKND